jgi:hypothetical protein
MAVHIFATSTQPDDPQAFFAFAQRIVWHELCYRNMTARVDAVAGQALGAARKGPFDRDG